MYWADRINTVTGGVLLVFGALLVLSVALDVTSTSASPLARGDTEEILRDLDSDRTLWALVRALNIATDAVVMLVMAAVLYVLLRDRSHTLAAVGALGLLGGAAGFAATDTAVVSLGYLASDFLEKGGAEGVVAGDPVILQSARTLLLLSMFATLCGLSSTGTGLLAWGVLIATAPEGEVNPPRWVGGLCGVSGLLMLSGWVAVAHWDTGMTLIFAGLVTSFLFVCILGGWLLFRAGQGEARADSRLAAAH